MHRRTFPLLRIFLQTLLILGLVVSLFQPQIGASAAASLTIEPLTWNVIGLDSNNVNVGPNHYPVGARVCNNGDSAATDVTATFVWDSANAFVDFRPGTDSTLSVSSLAAGACTDFYFEVQVTRSASAYNTTRRYHITATADGDLSVSTPTPRELFVEFLVSQNRNSVTDVKLDGVSISNGGTMTLLVGNTYTIQLVGNTATNGYEQIESFINFPNTIFQVLSVNTTYSAESSPTLAPPYDSLYGDACVWENNPNSPNYRSCLGVGKAGGAVTVTYQIRILQAPSAPLVNPSPLSTLIYDFSGSSYHYNADYGVSTRYAYVLDPAAVTIAKNFSPDPTTAGGISTLTFTLTNPTPTTMSGLNFTDSLPASPGAMTVASTPNVSTTGCGSPTFAPAAGSSMLSFSNGSIAPNSTCTIKVNVSVPTAGTYTNTTSRLFIGTLDTGNSATDTLTVGSTPPGPSPVCGLSLAQWTFPAGFSITSPAPSGGAGTATPGAGIVSTSFSEGTNSWGSSGSIGIGATLTTSSNDYVQFQLNTTGYSSVSLTFDAARKSTPNSPRGIAVYYSSGTANNPEPNSPLYTNSTALPLSTTAFTSFGALTFAPEGNTTYVRIYFFNAGNDAAGSDIFIDNVTFSGCATPPAPAITKTFSPGSIAVNGTSTLTFTLSNSNSVSLTGVTFSDTLPAGLQVAAAPAAATTCGGIPTWSPAAGETTLTFGLPNGGTIPASSSCTVSVNISGTSSGSYQNISGFVSSTNGGTNSGSTGSAAASLTVLKPPSMTKLFGTNPILAGGTTTLTFTISNPNLNDALTGVAFTDNYPTGVQNTATPGAATTCSGGSVSAAANGTSVSLSGATVAAGGSCMLTVNVTASTANTYTNTSNPITSTNGGTGNAASDTLTVESPNPAIALLKQISASVNGGSWTSYVTVDEASNVFYRFTVENIGDVPLSPVSVSDPSVSTAGCTWPASLPVAVAGNDNHIATCVVGPIAASSGSHINTATASGMFGGIPYTSTASSARYATPALALDKTATETSFTTAGDQLHYSYQVTNSGFAPLLGPVTVADDKTGVSCPAVDTVGDNDDYFDPGEAITCSAVYTVTGADVTAGSVTNTASATVDGVTSDPDSHTVNTLRPDLTVTKTNNVSGSLPQNGTFDWTITITNSGIAPASFADGNVILSDTLPGAESNYPDGTIPVTNGSTPPTGTLGCTITGTTLSCAADGEVILPVNGSFSVTFSVTALAVTSLANTAIVDPDNHIIEINEANNTGSDTVTVLAPPSIEKQFAPETIFVGETSTLTFQISNSNTGTALVGVSFTDNLPAGLVLAADVTSSQCGGTVTGTTGGTAITLSGGTLPASDTCLITAAVTASSAGTYVNTTENVSSTNGGTGNTATYALTVNPRIDLSLDKQASNDVPNVSDTLTFTLVVANAGPSSATSIVVTDVIPSGYSYVGSSISGGNTRNDSNPSTSGLNWTIDSLAAGSSVSLTYQVTVFETGTYDNYAEIQSHNETDADSTPGNASTTEDDDDTVSITPASSASMVLTKTAALDDTAAAPGGVVNAGDTITYTFSVQNTGNVTLTDISVTDPLLPGLICTIASLSPGSTLGCTAAENTYTLTQADIDSGSRANTATVTGQDPANNDVSDTDTKTTTLTSSPSIELTKTAVLDDTVVAPGGVVNTGDTITYSFTVENTGNVTITNIEVTDPLLPSLTCTIASLAPGMVSSCTAANNGYVLTQADIDAGSLVNTGTATGLDPDENGTTDADTETTALTQTPSLNLVKEVSNDNSAWDSSVSVTVGDTVYFRLRVSNTGNTTLTGLSVDDGMAGCTLARGPDLTGDNDTAFEAGEEWLYACSVTAVTGTQTNTATAGTNETPQDSDTASYAAGDVLVADPAISKAGSPSQATVGETVTFTITVTNTGNASASNVVVTDPLPAMFDVTAVTVTGAPLGTLVNVTPAIGTGPAPFTVVVTLGGDLAPSDLVTITIVTTVNGLGNPPVSNTASLTTSSLTDVLSNNTASATLTTRTSSTRRKLPDTGFASGVETVLPAQPWALTYASTDVVLEIPELGVKIPVVGVPKKNGSWNVSWLGEQAGWLEGSAFPSWKGNSVLTSHVYLANGLPGPFVNLNKLTYGERVIVHAFGQVYTFAVQTNTVVEPSDQSVMKHEDKPVLTLVTCKDYDEKTNSYLKRVVVRAVLVSVK